MAPSNCNGTAGRLLVVCPHFAPANGADGQRMRMYAGGLIEAGWQLSVLACDPAQLPINSDPLLSETLPDGLDITRVDCRPDWLGALAGSKTTGRNALRFVRQAGDRLLAGKAFDAVLFSTTAFRLLPLGLRWARRFGVPFVVDLQDPWYQDFYRDNPSVPPPGGRLRFALANAHARRWEGRVLAAAAGVVSVSEAYESRLQQRYEALAKTPFLHLPFGAARADFDVMRQADVKQSQFAAGAGRAHFVHVGRGGEDLWPALRPLMSCLARGLEEQSDWTQSLRLHFIGTSYAPPGSETPSILPLAQHLGAARVVRETPRRIDYFEALRCLADSSGIILPMSSDAGYNASKIHNCVLSGRPILALAAGGSVAASELRGLAPQITLLDPADDCGARIVNWLRRAPELPSQPAPIDYPFEAQNLAHKLAGFLREVAG